MKRETFLKIKDGSFKSVYLVMSIDFCLVCKTYGCCVHRKEIFGYEKPTLLFNYI